MNVFINIKAAGKRRSALEKSSYALPEGITTLRGLIEEITRREAESYNRRGTDKMIVPFLSEPEIEDKGATGKIGFGRLYSEKKADPGKAAAAALLGYEDGLFRVTVDGKEAAGLDDPLDIREGSTLTFIRLTFLAGRLW